MAGFTPNGAGAIAGTIDRKSDEAHALKLIADLGAAGYACWIDTTEIKGGDEWAKAIAVGINNSFAMVPIITAGLYKRINVTLPENLDQFLPEVLHLDCCVGSKQP